MQRKEGLAEEEKLPPAWDALNSEFVKLAEDLVILNNSEPFRGERYDLTEELNALWNQIGAPGEKSDAELASLRAKLRVFEKHRADDRTLALETWATLEEEYQTEHARLTASQELSDRKALEYLDAQYQRTKKRKQAAGDYVRVDDIIYLGTVMATELHLQKGWETALGETVKAAPKGKKAASKGKDEEALASWPWPSFEVIHHTIESGEKALHGEPHRKLERVLLRELQSANEFQIRQAVNTMLELGETPENAKLWAEKTLAKANETAEDLVNKIPFNSLGVSKWVGRIHIAGKIMVGIDIGLSVIDILASPPKERPKKIISTLARLGGALEGIELGAEAGEYLGSFGGEFTPITEPLGGFLGGIAGGIIGSTVGEKGAEFIADEIWPPEETYEEIIEL